MALKTGDKVRVIDGSYSYSFGDKGVKWECGISLKGDFEVMQTGLKMPIWESISGEPDPIHEGTLDNNTLIKEVSTGKIVSIQEDQLRKIEPAATPKFQVGDKVVPVSKNVMWSGTDLSCPIDNEQYWRQCKGRGYFYVNEIMGGWLIKENGQPVYRCGKDNVPTQGNYFLESDLIPYVEPVPEAKPEPKFKSGDRVKCIKSCDEKEEAVGKLGTVLEIGKYGGCSVEFDKYINGHRGFSGSEHMGKKGYCWCFESSKLDYLELVTEPTFNNRTETEAVYLFPFTEPITVKTIYKDRKTTCVYIYKGKGFKGVAKCLPDDTYSEQEGKLYANERARIELANYRIAHASS